ncbi:putative methyltransferase [Aspergillus terreus]|uniref:Putative methyltransferase n=1 Tax=Aspergillus terreus TaxID=33178 RepID=A0A5M3YRW6_ASPTE|nr:hypothetical protein ATETN484_0002011900 [Aspergillus terreus]GFF14902.1 putative methyltransferase [Aspergillus terreus]
MEDLTTFLAAIGEEVEDAEEESFLLFAQDIPSANLGFVDSRATTLDVAIHGQDYTIHQSPTLLSSSRAGGTTGAVLWKITPLFAEWISALHSNPLWRHALLTPSSTVVELGCGISGLIALALAPTVRHYIATDQDYVQRLLRTNLEANVRAAPRKPTSSGRKRPAPKSSTAAATPPNITFTTLDWELDVAASLKESVQLAPAADGAADDPDDRGFDLLLSCDCIYNEALVAPFVRACAEICGLRPAYTPASEMPTAPTRRPTICIIAQQQRSPDVFEAWLLEAMRVFRVWRVRDEVLGPKLQHGSGYLVHLLLLREQPLPGRRGK